MKCEKEGCNNERVCFHYCHDHHQEICMAGIVNHTELAAAQQTFALDFAVSPAVQHDPLLERCGCPVCFREHRKASKA